jgi:hypothetical protein
MFVVEGALVMLSGPAVQSTETMRAAEVTSSTRAPGRWTETRARAEDSLWLTADCRFVASIRAAGDDTQATQALVWKWPPGVCAEIRAGPRRSLVSRPRVHQMHRKAP